MAVAAGAGVRTTCPYCGVGCGVYVNPDGVLRGDVAHPANRGRLCSKGSALAETLGLAGRLLTPLMNERPVAWDAALDHVATRFAATIDQYGPDSVAFYVSGQLLTEDYYVANKLMKGFIGSANIDTNSRLCMASSVAGHRRAFGEDVVPGSYEDFECADLIVLVGSNTAWCHPVLYQRIQRAKEANGTKLIVIDPRRTATCESADLHLALTPGTDVLLFNGLLAYLARRGVLDRDFIVGRTHGFEGALRVAQREAGSLETVALRCGLARADVEAFYRAFAETPATVTAYSQGVNQSSRGTDKVNAIINCHLATGRVGRPGASPFSITGQPNAMGGREVGGLANQLAAHMSFDSPADIDRVQRFWKAPRIAGRPGLKAVDMFDAVAEGAVRAVWIMGTNPAVSLPNANRVREALARCDVVVVSDCVADTDTTAFAHILLPAAGWGEKDGTVTNSDRTISRQRALRPAPGDARPDWWIMSQVAARLGFGDAFAYRSAADVFREHAALTAFENEGGRCLNLGALAQLDDEAYDVLSPVQWPVTAAAPHGTARLFGDGRFSTADGCARFVTVAHVAPAQAPTDARPFVLNTGRIRDQWHTMTRTGGVPRLAAHTPEPLLTVNPADAAAKGIASGGLVAIESRYGTAVVRASVSDDVVAGTVFLPMHWSDTVTANGVAGRLINPDTDEISGQPELKHTPVSIAPVPVSWSGFLFSRTTVKPVGLDYWTRVAVAGGYLYELAGAEAPVAMMTRWRALSAAGPEDEIVEYCDPRRGALRLALLREGRLVSCLFVGPAGTLPDREWLLGQFETSEPLNEDSRRTLLSGRGPGAAEKKGPTICSCFNVGLTAILAAIHEQGAIDVRRLGEQLGAGTNCGSCIPELKAILGRETRLAAE